MYKYIMKRLLMMIPVLLGVTFIVFFIMALSPGDPAAMILGDQASAEALEMKREELGLNDPILIRYGNYIIDMLHGDLGVSYKNSLDVWEQVWERFPNTTILAIAGILAMNPKIIILDEATSMLDPMGRREINTIVKELNQKKEVTIISITHDIEEAKNADQVVILNSGKIVAQGKPKDILSNETNLRKYELDIPFALKVALGLQKNGIKTSKTLDMEVLIKELCQLHLKK